MTDRNGLQVNLADSCTLIYKRLYDSELILLGDDTRRGHQAANTATLNDYHTQKVKVLKCFLLLDSFIYFFSFAVSDLTILLTPIKKVNGMEVAN